MLRVSRSEVAIGETTDEIQECGVLSDKRTLNFQNLQNIGTHSKDLMSCPASPIPTARDADRLPPKIVRDRMKKLRSSRSSLLLLIEMRKSFDVQSKDYMDATRIIADMIADLRDDNLLCECSNECVDLKTFDSDDENMPKIVRKLF
jgi:hypothetical protein